MVISEDFKRIINLDIEACINEINNGSKEGRRNLHATLVSKYGKIIDGFKDDLISLFYDESGKSCLRNLETMKQKLELFKAMGYENAYSEKENGVVVNNTNHLFSAINISFQDAKKQVESMTSLKDEEIEEIQEKIDEIERIVNSKERKTKKWDKAKDIIKWVADKGVDVGITLLPLLLQIGQ